jgi:hypothetical protein
MTIARVMHDQVQQAAGQRLHQRLHQRLQEVFLFPHSQMINKCRMA